MLLIFIEHLMLFHPLNPHHIRVLGSAAVMTASQIESELIKELSRLCESYVRSLHRSLFRECLGQVNNHWCCHRMIL